MKCLTSALMAAAILLLIGALVRLPQRFVPVALYVYLGAQLFGCAAAFLSLQRTTTASLDYLILFSAVFLVSTIAIAILAAEFSATHPAGLAAFVWIGGFFLASVCVAVVRYYLLPRMAGEMNGQAIVIAAQAYVLMTCGMVALSTLAAHVPPASEAIRFALGTYWIAVAMFSFSLLIGSARAGERWFRLNEWVPGLIGLVIFAWLAFRLGGLQAELVRQTDDQSEHLEMAIPDSVSARVRR